MVEQATDEIGNQIGTQRPAGAEIAKHPDHVGYPGEHHAAPRYGLAEIERLAIDPEGYIAQGAQVEACCRDDQVSFQRLARLQHNPAGDEMVDLAGDHAGLAGTDSGEQIAIGHECQPLSPRPVLRREMAHVIALGQQHTHAFDQLGGDKVGLFITAPGDLGLCEIALAPGDVMDDRVIDFEQPQLVDKFIGIEPRHEIGR